MMVILLNYFLRNGLLWVEFTPMIIQILIIRPSLDQLIIRSALLLIYWSYDHWLYRNWLYDYTDLVISGSKDRMIVW